ncbi:MAG TPA: ADYC domain-containing protein [Myxococcales bacterium]|nr:ADYC domain-containing protein [Myxococcales bacterium]
MCLLIAGPALSADAGPGPSPTAERLARRCRPRAANRWWIPQGTLLWGTLRGWTEQAAKGDRGNVLASVDLDGSTPALGLEGGHLAGKGVVGAVLRGTDADGKPVEVAICDAEPSPEDPGTVWYRIQAWNPVAQDWQNPCLGIGDVLDPRALAVSGTWDEGGAHHDAARRFTFACENGAISKCARWGYRPWEVRDGRSLADAHQACTRMARADYCGNGKSHTREGALIDHYDAFGINARTTQASQAWDPAKASFEAAWAPDGAVCLARTRDDRALESILQECPGRFQPGAVDLGNGDRCAVRRPDASAAGPVLRNRSLPAAAR